MFPKNEMDVITSVTKENVITSVTKENVGMCEKLEDKVADKADEYDYLAEFE